MVQLPLKHGLSPKRWRECTDAVLEKIPGQPRIEKLRIIMSFEADFNYMLKLVWGRRLVHRAEDEKLLGHSQHGSRPGRQCTDACLEKLFLYKHARLTRTSMITVDNDARSCYDRIIKCLAMLTCISIGLSLLAATAHNKTHNGMRHRMKTRHGLSTKSYQSTNEEQNEGTGQGSGGSPAIWLVFMVTLLTAFRQFTPGMKVVSPFDSLLVLIVAIYYVDDGMPGVNDSNSVEPKTLAFLVATAESSAQSWERLLFISGGGLELSKCFTYILRWDFDSGMHPRLMLPGKIDGCVRSSDELADE